MKLRITFLVLAYQICLVHFCSAQTSGLAALFDLSKVRNITPDQALRFENILSKVLANPSFQTTYSRLVARQSRITSKGTAATPQDWSSQHFLEYSLVLHAMQATVKKDPTLAPVAAQVIAPVDPDFSQFLQRISKEWRSSMKITPKELMVRGYTHYQVIKLFPEFEEEHTRINRESSKMYANGRQPTPQELATLRSDLDHYRRKLDFAEQLVNPQVITIKAKLAAAKAHSNPTTPATPTSTPALPVPPAQGASALPSSLPTSAPSTPPVPSNPAST